MSYLGGSMKSNARGGILILSGYYLFSLKVDLSVNDFWLWANLIRNVHLQTELFILLFGE